MATPQEIQKLLDELKVAYETLGQINPFENFDTSNITNVNSTIIQLKSNLRDVNNQIQYISSGIGDVVSIFQSTVNEISKSNTALNDTKKTFNGLTSLAQQLRNDKEGIKKLNEKELNSIVEKVKIRKQELGDNRIQLEQRKEALIEENKSNNISSTQKKKNREEIIKISSAIRAANAEYKDGIGFSQDLITAAKDRIDLEQKIGKNIGAKAFSGIADLTKSIPGLRKFSEPFQQASGAANDMARNIEEAAKSGGKGLTKEKITQLGLEKTLGNLTGAAAANKLKGMSGMSKGLLAAKAGFKSLGPIIKKALGPLYLITELVKALIGADEATGNLAKNMNMTYSEASQMRMELNTSSNLSRDIFVNTKGMQESLMAINGTLGTNVMLNEKNLVTFTKLREAAGFTNEELMGMQSLANATGGDLESMTGEFLAQSRITATQNKAILNEKQLMKEISQVSAATTLSFSKNPSLIAEAVTTAKALGMEMSKVESIAESLLQFESSIENELQAELLLGKNINLEKARQAALNNDLKTVAEEIAKQAGSSEEFAKMNRIQQEALANAVGMGREELAKSLFLQEQIGNVSAEEYNLRKKQVEELEAKGLSQSQIKEKLAKTSIEDLQNQASVQDRLNKSVEKLREVFVSIADPIMQIVSPIIDLLIPALEGISFILTPLFTAFQGMSKILTGSFETLTGWQAVLGSIAVIYASIVGYQKISKAFSVAELALKESIIIQEIIQEGLEKRSLLFGKSKIIQLAAQAALWALANPIKALLGIAAAATVGVVANKYLAAGDINSPAKGKTQISTKEGGLFELSPNDDIIAAPGASAIMERATQPQQITGTTQPQQTTGTTQPQQTTVVQNDNTESKRTNMLLEQILSKQGTIKLDSTDMGTAIAINRYSIQ